MEDPRDPVAAVVHPDPYPYYAGLVAGAPLTRDDGLGLWIAARASAVTAVLSSPACRVRPATEPVPAPIAGTRVGGIYGAMMRFNDGARHATLKATLSQVLTALPDVDIRAHARRVAMRLAEDLRPGAGRAALMRFIVRLAPSAVASMLGAPVERLADVAHGAAAFVAATAPGASATTVREGAAAADALLDQARDWPRRNGVLAALVRHASPDDHDRVAANALGLLWQAHDATAAMIGNTLVALGRMPGISADHHLAGIVTEVARHDAPVQNTRRFVADDTVIAGRPLKRGDAVLVLLAAANRDPAANPEPARFDPRRASPHVFTFGHGPHACPGAVIATSIATAGVEALLAAGIDPVSLARDVSYRPSANIRMPDFQTAR